MSKVSKSAPTAAVKKNGTNGKTQSTPSAKKVKPKASYTAPIDDEIIIDDDGPSITPPPKKGAKAADKPETAPLAKDASRMEGLTKETSATGVISFKEGSGSADLLSLIVKHGFHREAVLKAAETLKKAGKAFRNCEPAKKYDKVAGLIKKMQNNGFHLPKAQ